MRYVELVVANPLVWFLFAAYLVGTAWLAWRGHKRTRKNISSFAVGNGDLHPVVVGITLAASIASTATFVINPGFVYVHGVSALMHYGVAAGSGVILGLLLLSGGFRRIGERTRAITLPQWVGQRYGSTFLTVLFAAVNLLSLFFMVLIVGGVSIVMQQTLGLTNLESLILVIGFVFGYTFVGGTYAHAYTNTLQGIIMAAVALVIVASGLPLLAEGGFAARIAAHDPDLLRLVNPTSSLYGSFFSVWVSGFVVGFAVVCQPHVLSKALYVKTDRAVRQYLGVAVGVSVVFSALLLVGLYARVAAIPAGAFLDPATGLFRQDLVMTAYLTHAFPPPVLAVVAVAILAAGMSTLDGILVALSTITANDLVGNLGGARLARLDDEARGKFLHAAGLVVLIALGLATFALCLRPPRLLGLFGQIGVYGIVAASTVPILYGILFPSAGRSMAIAASVTGLAMHFGLTWYGIPNPAVSATWALIASATVGGAFVLVGWAGAPHAAKESMAPGRA